jgi:hypothetical protein
MDLIRCIRMEKIDGLFRVVKRRAIKGIFPQLEANRLMALAGDSGDWAKRLAELRAVAEERKRAREERIRRRLDGLFACVDSRLEAGMRYGG